MNYYWVLVTLEPDFGGFPRFRLWEIPGGDGKKRSGSKKVCELLACGHRVFTTKERTKNGRPIGKLKPDHRSRHTMEFESEDQMVSWFTSLHLAVKRETGQHPNW